MLISRSARRPHHHCPTTHNHGTTTHNHSQLLTTTAQPLTTNHSHSQLLKTTAQPLTATHNHSQPLTTTPSHSQLLRNSHHTERTFKCCFNASKAERRTESHLIVPQVRQHGPQEDQHLPNPGRTEPPGCISVHYQYIYHHYQYSIIVYISSLSV